MIPNTSIITYNIYQGGRDKVGEIHDFLTNQQPDILAIQEACNWDQEKQQYTLASKLNIPEHNIVYAHANPGRSSANRIYDLILFSRFPIISQSILNDPNKIWHAAIISTIDVPNLEKVQIINCHLSSKSVEWRLKELDFIFNHESYHDDIPTILMGDLNSLSPNDPYQSSITQELKDQNITKFDNPPTFNVLKKLFQMGFENHCLFEPTVLSSAEDKDHLDLRLDYILTKHINHKQIHSCTVMSDESAKNLSDHFPVKMMLQ